MSRTGTIRRRRRRSRRPDGRIKATRRQLRGQKLRRRLQGDLKAFVRFAWPVLNPGVPLVWNWHLDALCEHLEAVTEGRIKTLVVNIPPGHCKTTIVSVCWPVWEWLRKPWSRWIFAANEKGLAVRDNLARRTLLTSDRFRAICRPDWGLKHGEKGKMRFVNTEMGSMRALSVGSKVTGDHADTVVIDDPLDAAEVFGPGLEKHIEWWRNKLSTRVRDDARIVLVMQRLHEGDLAGYFLERERKLGNLGKPGGCDHLLFPTHYDPDRAITTSLGWRDPRTVKGALLWPERFPVSRLRPLRVDMGPVMWAAQMEQDPKVGDGKIFERGWWRRWKDLPSGPDVIWLGSIDGTFHGDVGADFCVLQVWAFDTINARAYLVHQERARMSMPELLRETVRLARDWPEVTRWLVEEKANGRALVDSVSEVVAGVVGVSPRGRKESRWHSVTGMIESGHVYIPDEGVVEWDVEGFIEECARIPGGNDDQADAMAQALDYGRVWILSQAGAGSAETPTFAGLPARSHHPGF